VVPPDAESLEALERRRAELRERYLRPPTERPASSARGVHHVAVLCADVEQTVRFYQDLLEFPLTDLFENRDAAGVEYQHVDESSLYFRDPDGTRVELISDPLGEMYGFTVGEMPDHRSH
jgi:catechol-2,3-dioxygenase